MKQTKEQGRKVFRDLLDSIQNAGALELFIASMQVEESRQALEDEGDDAIAEHCPFTLDELLAQFDTIEQAIENRREELVNAS